MLKQFKIIDEHIHYALPISFEELERARALSGADGAVLVTVPDRSRVLVTPEALMMKAHAPDRYYVFTSLDVSEYFKHPKAIGRHFAKYVKRAMKMGCDGVKLIEGKPDMRKRLPIPDFDSECWEEFWAYAEREQVPILWHVNDPEEFWDIDRIPAWAKERGWFYDESYVNNEAQYTQVMRVLERHPKLKITFAHFFFMSAQLERLQGILDAYPNVAVDITPGIELYMKLSENPERSREFFIKNRERILYGTDIGARSVLGVGSGINMEESLRRSEIVQEFLTGTEKLTVHADGNFLIGTEDFELNALNLPEEVLRDIFSENLLRRVGKPGALHPRLIIRECRRIKRTITIMSFMDKAIKRDFSYAESVIAYFNKK